MPTTWRLSAAGASALCVLGLLARRTLDIDAIGLIGTNEEIVSIEEFSPEVNDAIAAAGLSLGLLPGWFNGAASAVLARGLPVGALERSAVQAKAFGPCLTVHFMDRIDLIALKMYAALDPKEGRRHVKDLIEIGEPRGVASRDQVDRLPAIQSRIQAVASPLAGGFRRGRPLQRLIPQ